MADLKVFVGLVGTKTVVRVAETEVQARQGLDGEPTFLINVENEGTKKPPPELEGILDAIGLFGQATKEELEVALLFMLVSGIEIGSRIRLENLEKPEDFVRVTRSVFGLNPVLDQEPTDRAPPVTTTLPPPGHDDPTDRPPVVGDDQDDPGHPEYKQPKGC